jgi:hypothetical protein
MPKPPVILLLLADCSFENYTTTAFGLRNFVEKNRDAVRAPVLSFPEACASGQIPIMKASWAACKPKTPHARLGSSPGYLRFVLAVRSKESLATKVAPHQFEPRPLGLIALTLLKLGVAV